MPVPRASSRTPEIVLGAVRRAPLVNGDPLMRDLRGDGHQG
ncbi:hypothetical protein ACQEUU_20985 [Nonomuraea sp. CA-218870]